MICKVKKKHKKSEDNNTERSAAFNSDVSDVDYLKSKQVLDPYRLETLIAETTVQDSSEFIFQVIKL